MKKHLLFLALVCLIPSLHAQIIITNATFPIAGDTLKTVTDDTPPAGVTITPPGGPQTWDFSQLDGTNTQEEVYRNASEGAGFANFPGATLFTDNQVTETYYTNDAGTFSVLGFNGQVPAGGFPIEAVIKYNPPFIQQRAPLQFFDIYQTTTDLTIPFAVADLPSEIVDSLGVLTGLADSIRIRINISQLSTVDGYGTLAIPGGTYDVLRQKSTNYQTVRFDVHTFLGWIDVTDQVIQAGLPGFGTDTSYIHLFLSNDAKEPIAAVSTSDGLNVTSVTYKNNGVTSSAGEVTSIDQSLVMISPNPAFSETTIQLENIPDGSYLLTLYDMQGSKLFSEKINSITTKISLADMATGTYIGVLTDTSGKYLWSGQVIKAERK
jgi:hypothetical protein